MHGYQYQLSHCVKICYTFEQYDPDLTELHCINSSSNIRIISKLEPIHTWTLHVNFADLQYPEF